jgi:hypothetical protein
VDFAWREPNVRVDKIHVALNGTQPVDMGPEPAHCTPVIVLPQPQPRPPIGVPISGILTFPNPAGNLVTVDYHLPGEPHGEGMVLRLINVFGQTLSTHALPQAAEGRLSLDLSDLPAGTYFIVIENGRERLRQSLIKVDE